MLCAPDGLLKHFEVVVNRWETKTVTYHTKNLTRTKKSHEQLLNFYGGSHSSPQGKEYGCIRLPRTAIISSSYNELWEASTSQPYSDIHERCLHKIHEWNSNAHDDVFAADDVQTILHFPNHMGPIYLIKVLGQNKSKRNYWHIGLNSGTCLTRVVGKQNRDNIMTYFVNISHLMRKCVIAMTSMGFLKKLNSRMIPAISDRSWIAQAEAWSCCCFAIVTSTHASLSRTLFT